MSPGQPRKVEVTCQCDKKEPLMSFLTKKQKGIESSSVTTRQFRYSLNGCTLDFTLRNDIEGQLRDYVELLKRAQKDVEAELEKTILAGLNKE